MPPHPTDSENRALIAKAIKYAKDQSTSDADFVQILRATYFANHPELTVHLRNGSTRAVRGTRTIQADPSFHIYDDPRFLKNARVFAERVSKRLRIMGGTDVAAKGFPDCVAVGDVRGWGCTGTLIAPKLVVCAGHCAKLATRVFFGNDVNKKGIEIGVDHHVQHPGYHKGKKNDLLLLILGKAAKPKPRRIAKSSAIDSATDGRAVGFGSVDATGRWGYGIKRQVDLPIASSNCAGKVSGETDSAAYGCDRMLEMVAGKPLLARDSCSGDSGGPFYIADKKGGWLLAGATSRSTDSAASTCGDGGIYVRVDQYREWIEDTARIKLA